MNRFKSFLKIIFSRPAIAIFLFLGVTAGLLYYRFHLAKKQSAIVQRIKDRGNAVYYDFHLSSDLSVHREAQSPVPKVLVDWFGIDFFHSIVSVPNYCNLNDLESLTELKELTLNRNPARLSVLRNLRELERLRVGYNSDFNCSLILGHRKLKSVTCRTGQLDALSTIPSLEELRLRTSNSNWEGLGRLENLRKLDIESDGNIDITELRTLKKLETLRIQCSEFPNLSFVDDLPALGRIELYLYDRKLVGRTRTYSANQYEKSSAWKHDSLQNPLVLPETAPKQLKRLVIHAEDLSRFPQLKNYHGLEELSVNTNSVHDFSDFLKTPNLKKIQLNISNDFRFNKLVENQTIESMQIRFEPLDSGMGFIGQTIGVTDTRLNRSHFTLDLQSFPKLTGLRALSMENIYLNNLEELQKFSNLRSICLYQCAAKVPEHLRKRSVLDWFSNISTDPDDNHWKGLFNQQNLTSLTLHDLYLPNYVGISKLKNLETLNIKTDLTTSFKRRMIPPWDELKILKNLKALNINSFICQDLGFLENHKQLQELSLTLTNTTDISMIGELRNLKSLSLKFVDEKKIGTRGDIDLSFLKGNQLLETLSLNEFPYKEFDSLTTLPHLRQIGKIKKDPPAASRKIWLLALQSINKPAVYYQWPYEILEERSNLIPKNLSEIWDEDDLPSGVLRFINDSHYDPNQKNKASKPNGRLLPAQKLRQLSQ